MLDFKQIKERIQRKAPRSLLDEQVLRIQSNSVEEIYEEATQFFDCPLADLTFEIENITKNPVHNKKRYSIIAYPKRDYLEEAEQGKALKNKEGEAFIRLSAGAILLLVTKPLGNSEPIKYASVVQMAREKLGSGYVFSEQEIKRVVQNANEQWNSIGSFAHDALEDAKYIVSMSDDNMTGFIEIIRAGPYGADPSFAKMMQELERRRIIFGINEEKLRGLERKPIYNRVVEIAFGRPVEHGSNAKIELKQSQQERLKQLKDKNVKNIVHVAKKGEVVAQKTPPTRGVDGETIMGEILFANPGEDIVMTGNTHVLISEDNTKAIAKQDGSVKIIDRQVVVERLLIIDSSLSLETGDIDFPGSVWIQGDIPDDFDINVKGDLQVDGGIANSTLRIGGNLNVARGINGRGSAVIDVRGSLITRFLEGVTVNVMKDCIVEQAIISSTVFARGKIVVVTGKGKVISSTITAGHDIFVRSVGSELGSNSTLEIRSLPELRKHYEKLYLERIEKKKELDKINLFLGKEDINTMHKIIKEDRLKQGKSKITKDKHYEKVVEEIKKIKKLQLELKEITKGLKMLKEKLSQAKSNARLCVLQDMMGGTNVSIDEAKLTVKNDISQVVFSLEDDRIAIRYYNSRLDGADVERVINSVR